MKPRLTQAVLILSSALILSVYCKSVSVNYIETNYGDNTRASQKILVAYATRSGSTAEVADFIGKTLAGKGETVDVKPVNNVKDLIEYKAAIIGSAIQAGDVLPEVTKFVKAHKSELERISVSYFIVCMILKDNTEKNQKKAYGYIDSLIKEIKPINTGLFAGKLDYSKLGTFDYIIIKYFVGTPEGDYRDWEAIRAWSNDLLPKLKLN